LILKSEKLRKMLLTYYLTIEPYIGYQLNDKYLKNETNLIKKVKKLWCSQILSLISGYKKLLENRIA
jgi:hypothetical protein